MKHLLVLITLAVALALPATNAAAAARTFDATMSAPTGHERAAPAAGVLPDQMCDAGRSFFASFIGATQGLKDVFGPGEQTMCGARKAYPA